MTMFRLLPVLALAVVATAARAQATDEMVVSNPHPSAPPAATAANTGGGTAKPLTTDEQIKAWITDAPKLGRTPAGDAATDASGKRQMHGSAGVSVGSGGYSSAYVSTLIPVGKTGTLGLAYSQTDYGNNPVYGYGRGYGRYRHGGGRSQSVAVMLDMSGGQDASTPEGCVPGFSDGGRYMEPVWVSRLHPEMSCIRDTETHSETTFGQ